jgi:hypothetical protein
VNPRKNAAAVSLGRRGGKAKSTAKAAASRANGTRGGRPVRTVSVGVRGEGKVEMHVDVELVGYTVQSKPAWRAKTPAAARWLKRRGYEYAKWQLAEVFAEVEKTWA